MEITSNLNKYAETLRESVVTLHSIKKNIFGKKSQRKMKNVAFNQLKKNILSDSHFYVNPIKADYKDDKSKWRKRKGKVDDTAVYIIVMYTLSAHYNEINPKIATVIESWIEKKIDFDWTSLDFQDILPLFREAIFRGKRDIFREIYLDDVNLENWVDGDEKHLEIGSDYPCKDSIVCLSPSSRWRDIVYYLFLIDAGRQSQAIIYNEGELWRSITDKYSAILIDDSSCSADDILQTVNSAFQHLMPDFIVEGGVGDKRYVILQYDYFVGSHVRSFWTPIKAIKDHWDEEIYSIVSGNHKLSDEDCFVDELLKLYNEELEEDINKTSQCVTAKTLTEERWKQAVYEKMKYDKEFNPEQPIEIFRMEDDYEQDLKLKIRDVIGKLIEDKLLHAVVWLSAFPENYLRFYIAPESKGVHLLYQRKNEFPFCDKFERQFIDINLARNIDLITYMEHLDLNLKLGENLVKIKDILEAISPMHIKGEHGRLFKYQNMSTGYDNWARKPKELDIENVSGEFIKATEPVCVLTQNLKKPVMTYLLASENEPVYIGKQFMVFKLKETFIQPCYFYHIVFNGEFSSCISDEQMDTILSYQGGLYQVSETEWKYYDDPGISSKICSTDLWLKIPREVKIQESIFASAKDVWNVMEKKIEVQKANNNELEWLNEEHIRNIKHKTRGDLDCIKGDLSTLMKAFQHNKGQLHLNDKFSPASNRNVEQAIESMLRGLTKVVDTVAELTDVAKNRTEINLYEFFQEYADHSHYANQCNICIFNMAKDLNILVDSKNLHDILDLFIENALRHGKINDPNAKLIIRISCEDCYDGKCLITLENNGKPMTPRAKEIYFVRDSYAGETANTGQGGADIKKLVTSNHGSVELHAADDAEYPVGLWMYFDIVNK